MNQPIPNRVLPLPPRRPKAFGKRHARAWLLCFLAFQPVIAGLAAWGAWNVRTGGSSLETAGSAGLIGLIALQFLLSAYLLVLGAFVAFAQFACERYPPRIELAVAILMYFMPGVGYWLLPHRRGDNRLLGEVAPEGVFVWTRTLVLMGMAILLCFVPVGLYWWCLKSAQLGFTLREVFQGNCLREQFQLLFYPLKYEP